MSKNSDNRIDRFVNTSVNKIRISFEPGEQVEGTVTAITRDAIFLDINAKSEGIIDRRELENNDVLSVKEGDTLKAFFVRAEDNGELILTVEGSEQSGDNESIENSYHAKIPIVGKVMGECKGGYEIMFGNRRAFCPFSQIDVNPSPEKSFYCGQKFSFVISEYGENNIVVSRRKFLESQLERERENLRETLCPGTIVTGVVKRIMEFGVFVDLGGGVDGLIPMGELAWGQVKSAEEITQVGEKLAVKILNVRWNENRVTLSLKQTEDSPWLKVKENYHVTKQYSGLVTRLMKYGAFVALEPGVEGLIHISKLGHGKRLSHAAEVLEEGQEISVFIEAIDYENRRISLTLENPQEGRTMDVDGDQIKIGQMVTGIVEGIKPFGIFVKLTSTATGLLHISEIPLTGAANTVKSMMKRYPPGSEISVMIKKLHQSRISLALPGADTDEHDEFRQYIAEKKDPDDFGSLGSAFDNIQLQ